MEKILRSTANWSRINATVTAMQKKLQELERAQKAGQTRDLVALVST